MLVVLGVALATGRAPEANAGQAARAEAVARVSADAGQAPRDAAEAVRSLRLGGLPAPAQRASLAGVRGVDVRHAAWLLEASEAAFFACAFR